MMNRSITTFPLLFTSVSAILGSGWLFSVYYTATYAGPSSLLSWIIGGFAVIVIAFVYAEICSMLPIMGASARIPQYSHGTITGFIFSWLIWLSYVALPPVEVQGVLQYLSYFFPQLIQNNGGLTALGYWMAAVLMLLVSFVNTYSLKWLLHCNTYLTLLKIFIPIFIAVAMLVLLFSPHKILNAGNMGFLPLGTTGMFKAITVGGIIFAFNGFKQACEMAGEAKNPHKALPIAIIGSILICLVIYILLQIAFLSSLDMRNLRLGWPRLQILHKASPIIAAIHQNKMDWLIPILYVGAIAAPFAASLMYVSSASRSLYGLSKNIYLPKFLQILSKKGIPFYAIGINFLVGMCMFAPLPGWDKMVSFLTSIMAITYSIAPISLLALRKQLPDKERPLKLPLVEIWALLSFYFCTIFSYWSGWNIISKFSLALLAGAFIFFIYHYTSKRKTDMSLDWKASIWVWPYFIGLTIISYLGTPGGGRGLIPLGYDYIIIFVFCIVIMWISVLCCLTEKKAKYYIRELGIDLHHHN